MEEMRKAFVVTGAASGLGRATAERLARRGRVFALDVNAEALRSLSQIEGITVLRADVTDSESIRAAVREIEAASDGIDGLVNCAGMIVCGPLVELREEDMVRLMDVNVLGAFRVTRGLFRLLLERRGRVVNISSECGRLSAPFNGPYSMSKYAMEAFSDALRRELLFKGMKVVIVQPGPIRTPLVRDPAKEFDRYLESSAFEQPMRRVRDLSTGEWKKGVEPDVVAQVIEKALVTRWPRVRYRVNNDWARSLLEPLPARWTDLLIGWVLARRGSAQQTARSASGTPSPE
jgi:NAD(P)-dependent dehydrogenase (short-subunit alcohol dehydrogenase family)